MNALQNPEQERKKMGELFEYHEEMPASWLKKYKSRQMKSKISDSMMWFLRPSPNSREGKRILKANSRLFEFLERLDDFEYAIEPVENTLFEAVPGDVNRQGIGFSANPAADMLEMDLYFFPCDYSEDETKSFPPNYIRVPVALFGSEHLDFAEKLLRKHFAQKKRGRKTVLIPFSPECTVELTGYFMDHYAETEKKCLKAVQNQAEEVQLNCDRFLDFVRTAGKA
ncbi:MAG: hypothetical protein E7190_02445 [Erysipelotrichaceae bacterium]|nr:hypothetical protein [Erysipelotrichaceae bacterium]